MTENNFNANILTFHEKISSSPWIILLIFYLLILGVRIWVSFSFVGPQVIPDEITYDSIVGSIFEGTFISSGVYASTVPPGYPLFLSTAYLFTTDKLMLYYAHLILNALVVTTVLFPVFFFLRDWCTKEIAFCGAIIIATLPSISKSTGLVMSENLFIPLIVFAFYFIYQAFKTDSTYIALLAGFLSFCVFFTRSTGIAILIALVCGLFWYCFLHRKKGVSFSDTLRKKWTLLAGCFIPCISWTMFLIGTGKDAIGYDPDVMTTNYVENLGTNLILYLQTCIIQFDYVLLTSYIVGSVVAVYVIYLILRQHSEVPDILKNNQTEDHEKKSTALSGITGFSVSLIALLALVPLPLLAYVYESPIMYGRYYDPILPVLFIFTIIGMQYLISKEDIAKTHIYGICLLSIVAGCFTILTMKGGGTYLDEAFVNVSLPYLYFLPALSGMAIVLLLFSILLPTLLVMGMKNLRIMQTLLIVILSLNIIISVPMFQIEIKNSISGDETGIIGKVIEYNINPNAIIILDTSFDQTTDIETYNLIDYWIPNELYLVNLLDLIVSGKYSALEEGDYLITAVELNSKPIYTSPSGLAIYSIRSIDIAGQFGNMEGYEIKWVNSSEE